MTPRHSPETGCSSGLRSGRARHGLGIRCDLVCTDRLDAPEPQRPPEKIVPPSWLAVGAIRKRCDRPHGREPSRVPGGWSATKRQTTSTGAGMGRRLREWVERAINARFSPSANDNPRVLRPGGYANNGRSRSSDADAITPAWLHTWPLRAELGVALLPAAPGS